MKQILRFTQLLVFPNLLKKLKLSPEVSLFIIFPADPGSKIFSSLKKHLTDIGLTAVLYFKNFLNLFYFFTHFFQ